jgi:S1-C subfamily serine protease
MTENNGRFGNYVRLAFFAMITALVLCNTFNLNKQNNTVISADDKDVVQLIEMNEHRIKGLVIDNIATSKAIVNLHYTPADKMGANVLVLTEKGGGSGSVIKVEADKSYVLTAAHVVSSVVNGPDPKTLKEFKDPTAIYSNSRKVSIAFSDKKEYAAMIVKIDYENDMALLRIGERLDVTPIKIAKEEPKAGEVVWGISNPGGTFGIINNGIFSTPVEEASLVSIAGYFGSSGGMCLNNKGEQIGVISTVLTARLTRFTSSLTVYMGISRTADLNNFLKGII